MRDGWEYKKLGEVCSPKKEIKRATKVFAPNDTIKYIDISSIDNSTQRMTSCSNYIMSAAPSRAQQCVIKGDIIVSTVRPNLKNIATVDSNDNNLVASSGFCVLRPLNIERNYMFHYIKSDKFTNHIMGLTTGANYPAVRDSDILDSIIPVPPLSTQLSIVSELDKINELIRLKKEQLSDYDKLAQSLFYEMFGDPVENEKGWEVKKLGEVCEVSSFKRVLVEDVLEEGPVPFIRGTELSAICKENKREYKMYITMEHYERVKNISGVPNVGDLLIPSINAEGLVWVVDTPEPMYYKDGRVLWVHVDQNSISPIALQRILNNLIKDNYSKITNGAVFAELNLSILRSMIR